MSSEGNVSNSNDYLTLKPESASLLDLFLFTLSFKFVNIRNLIDCPPGKEQLYQSFGNRWIIVSSILLEKFLITIAKHNQSFKNMRAKIWGVPQKISARKVNCRDWKIQVGKNNNIKLDDNEYFRYYGSLTIMASTLAYQEPDVVKTVVENCWKMKLHESPFNFWNEFQKKASTQAFAFQNTASDPNVTIVAFRGSSELDDWCVNFDISWYNIENIGHIHHGFMKALGLQSNNSWPKELPYPSRDNPKFAYYYFRQLLKDIAKSNDNAKFIITGHSLGGALATLFVTILALHGEFALLQKLHAVYTFGQPRVGNRGFAVFMDTISEKYVFQYNRYVYSFDMVPRVPFDFYDLWYKHFGGCLYYNCCYKAQLMEVEPNHNYFFEIWVIPRKYLTALWELIRSLIIPIFKGRDYFEGFCSLLFRLFGLLLPGASAHMCMNYINSTRFGKIQQLSQHIIKP